MPPDQRVRFHDRERGSPVDQLREHHERDPRRIIGPAGFHPTLPIECQLLPKKQILGPRCERDRRPSDPNLTASTSNRTAVRHTIDEDDCFRMLKDATRTRRTGSRDLDGEIAANPFGRIFADHNGIN
jgi:hypothetical protein